MTAGSMVTIACLRPPIWIQNVSPKTSLYLDKTCTGLRAIAGESAKQRNRETTGTGVDELIARRPDRCFEPNQISCHMQEAVAGPYLKDNCSDLVFVPQLLQKYQMMPDCPRHGGVLPIGNPKLFGGLLHDPGQRSIVGMTNERAQMVNDVMVEAADEPTDKRVLGRIISRRGEDVIYAIVKLAAV